MATVRCTLIYCAILYIISGASATQLNQVEKIFRDNEIVPDIIPKAPKEFLKVIYGSGVSAESGIELTPTQVKEQPVVEWEAEANSFYTLIMTDPDAPSRSEPKFREFNHWLIGNIPGNDLERGDVIAAYVGSGPPKGTGLHRYIFLLYKQPGKLDFDEARVSNTSRQNRPKFHAAHFAEKYNLATPIAGNFYQAKWDEFVPTVHKQLSGNN